MKLSKFLVFQFFLIFTIFFYLKSVGDTCLGMEHDLQALLQQALADHVHVEFTEDEEEYDADTEEADLDEITVTNCPNDVWMINAMEIIRTARRYKFQIDDENFEYLSRRNIQRFMQIFNEIIRLQESIQEQINITRSDEFLSDEFLEDELAQENYEILIRLLHEENRYFVRLLVQLQEITARRETHRRIKSLSSSRGRRGSTREYREQKSRRKHDRRRTHSEEHYTQEDFLCS